MAFDFSKLKHRQDFGLETDSLGTIQCGSLTLGMLSKIEKDLKVNDLDSVVFARQLLREVGCHITEREGNEIDNQKHEIENALLADEDIDCISDDEIETFAREFVTHNDWLIKTFEGEKCTIATNENGENVVSVQATPIDLPKEDSERDSDYLVRVLRRYLDEKTTRIRKMFRPVFGSLFRNTFSSATEDLLKKHVSLSDQLGKTLRGLGSDLTGPRLASIVEPRHMDIKVPVLPENPIYETNRRLGDVLDHAEEVRPIILQSAELFQSMSNTALQMHADFNRSARYSLFVSLIVVCIAGVSLVVTALYSWSSPHFSPGHGCGHEYDYICCVERGQGARRTVKYACAP